MGGFLGGGVVVFEDDDEDDDEELLEVCLVEILGWELWRMVLVGWVVWG